MTIRHDALDLELRQLENVLEAHLPGNPNRPINEKLAKDLEAEVREYFDSLLTAFPWERVEQLYYHNVKQE